MRWLIGVPRPTDQARKARGLLVLFVAAILFSTPLYWVTGWRDVDGTQALASALQVPALFGLWRAYSGESWIGGLMWLIATPACCIGLVINGLSRLPGDLSSALEEVPKEMASTDVLNAAGNLIGSLLFASWWIMFLLYYGQMQRWTALVGVLTWIFFAALIVSAVAIAVISGGENSLGLIVVAISLGISALAGGAAGIKKFVQRMRV